MKFIKRKNGIIILIIFIVLIFIINELTSYCSPSVPIHYLDEINTIDWSADNLNDCGFSFEGEEAFFTIDSDEDSVCRITVKPIDNIDGKFKKYKNLRYSARRVQFGIFDIRRYLDSSNYITDYYTFVCGDVCITAIDHAWEKDNLYFFDFIVQIKTGEGKTEVYEPGFGKYRNK